MSPEGGPRKPIRLRGEAGRVYQEIRRDHGVKLNYEARHSLAQDPEAAAFLRGFQYYLDHKDELLADHRGKWIAITAEGVLATAPSYAQLIWKTENEFNGRRVFCTIVRDPSKRHGVPRLSFD